MSQELNTYEVWVPKGEEKGNGKSKQFKEYEWKFENYMTAMNL